MSLVLAEIWGENAVWMSLSGGDGAEEEEYRIGHLVVVTH